MKFLSCYDIILVLLMKRNRARNELKFVRWEIKKKCLLFGSMDPKGSQSKKERDWSLELQLKIRRGVGPLIQNCSAYSACGECAIAQPTSNTQFEVKCAMLQGHVAQT